MGVLEGLAASDQPIDARRHQRAWLVLVAVLAVHVADEALTGFLDFYNPLVQRIRGVVPWFPMPTFTFQLWLVGLAGLVVALTLLTPVVRRGGIFASFASWLLSGIMLLNGLGHLTGSVYFHRWLPGATSAPLLLAASLLLMWETRQHGRNQYPHR